MSSRSLPVDQAARNDAINQIGKSILLEAGAGAGKTRVMVDRIVQTVASGRVELRQLAAITFTEKAAGELRARVRQALAEAIENRGGSRGEEEIERLAIAQGQVDAAHIETIHAFASSLLRERPFEAGIDPRFEILDQLGASLDLDEAWREWLWEEHDPGAAAAIELARSLGRLALPDIREAADLLSKYRDLPPPRAGAEMPDAREALEQWRFDAAEVAAAYAGAGTDKQREACAQLVDGIEELAGAPPAQLAQRMLDFRPKKPSSTTRSAAARARWDAAAKAREQFAAEVREGILGSLLDALGAFVADHAAGRRRDGKLNFDDLLLCARDLVRDHRDARAYFRRRYRVILIDEFQDTDPLQAELVLLLASGADTDDWRKAPPDAGRLFLVGDPKQSIYRFRRADISIYNAVRDMFLAVEARDPEAAAVRQLTVNFRSRPDLIGWTNRVFQDVLQADPEFPGVQADFQPTDPHRERPGTAVLTVDDPTEYRRVGEARDTEAAKLADVINALVAGAEVGGQALLLPDEHDGASRVPAYGDIAVLVRTRTEIDKYTRVLDRARIPYHLDSGRGFFARPEVRDLTNILMAVDDPTDEVAILAALKSPLASASDQELFDYVHAREPDEDGKRRPARFSLGGRSVPEAYDGPLRGGFELLRRLRDGLRSRSLPQFIDFTLRESHLLDAQFAHGVHGEERAANLQMLVLRAAEFARAEGDSLRPFVQWLAQRREQDLSEAESSTSEVAGKVVRILTIHQAKGLEFPIVIVPKLGDGTTDRTRVIVDRATERLDIQIGSNDKGMRTPGFDRPREQAYNQAEARRQLYVAATRAKDWLILPRFFKNGKPSNGSFGDFLDEPLAAVPAELMQRTRPSDYDATAPEPRETTLPDWSSIHAAWQMRRDEALERGAIDVIALTPSDHEDGQTRDEEKAQREQAVQPDDQAAGGADAEPREGADGAADDGVRRFIPNAKARAAGMHRGSAIHRALSLADFADHDESIRRARRVFGEFPDLDPNDLFKDFSNVLSAELARRAGSADQYFLEMPLVSARQTGDRITITEGIADLAFREARGWVVVDFKSDRSRDAGLDARYQRQVRDYARMLRDAGQPVSEAWLLYTRDGVQVRVPLDPPG